MNHDAKMRIAVLAQALLLLAFAVGLLFNLVEPLPEQGADATPPARQEPCHDR
jgi:hypothetical protein